MKIVAKKEPNDLDLPNERFFFASRKVDEGRRGIIWKKNYYD